MYRKYTKELLEPVVKDSFSLAQVMRKLGFNGLNGGSIAHVKKKIIDFDISMSHFTGKGSNRGLSHKGGKSGQPVDKILAVQEGLYKVKTKFLKRAMLSVGVEYVCQKCLNTGTWQSETLTLQIDHINGNPMDCRKENLRFLCPNCHSQTENFVGKRKKSE